VWRHGLVPWSACKDAKECTTPTLCSNPALPSPFHPPADCQPHWFCYSHTFSICCSSAVRGMRRFAHATAVNVNSICVCAIERVGVKHSNHPRSPCIMCVVLLCVASSGGSVRVWVILSGMCRLQQWWLGAHCVQPRAAAARNPRRCFSSHAREAACVCVWRLNTRAPSRQFPAAAPMMTASGLQHTCPFAAHAYERTPPQHNAPKPCGSSRSRCGAC
jgi:hypothetical protein